MDDGFAALADWHEFFGAVAGAAATDLGIIYLPSSWFYTDFSWKRSMRLNFSSQPEERIAEAMGRLGEAIGAV